MSWQAEGPAGDRVEAMAEETAAEDAAGSGCLTHLNKINLAWFFIALLPGELSQTSLHHLSSSCWRASYPG